MGGWASHSGQKLALIKTDSLGCDGTDWWDYCTNVMVNEFVDNPSFEMYPNPATNNVQLTISNVQLDVQTVQIYDLAGKQVKQFKIQNSELKIKTGDLEKGVYIVKVGKQTKKLIVE